jgi:hypothetical protein
MLVLEFNLVEMDWCPECRGAWLDSGELELVGQRAGALCAELEHALLHGRSGPEERSGLLCPVCDRRLVPVQADTEPPVVVDRCPQRHGIWFERGELQTVVVAAGADEENPLAGFFGELTE